VAGAKLRAWWEGEAFDEEAFLAGLAAAPAANAENHDLTDTLFDAPADPRLDALQRLWGEGRLAPSADEPALLAMLAAPPEANLALLGPGLFAPAAALAGEGVRALTIYEWRSETRDALARALKDQGVAKAVAEPFDLDVTTLPAETFDGLISFDDFTYAANPARLALQIARTLKPGSKAVIETYVAAPGAEIGAAFASAFAEPQMHADGVLAHAFTEAGLDIEKDEDISAAHIAAARQRFQAFSESMAQSPTLPPGEARELAWETQTWRTRLKFIAHGRLQRRRFLAHRRV
jgi:SAM-dependent methyltransferase